ncbi:hypothetical protein PRJBM_01335 [Bartonella henselae]|nr:hypothetical protein PRJBM_01335 [Bartonella henselae]CUH91263.1 hypothetical protein BM1374164_01335 [Bartonella henselae]
MVPICSFIKCKEGGTMALPLYLSWAFYGRCREMGLGALRDVFFNKCVHARHSSVLF